METNMAIEITAQEVLDIIKDIPEDQFITQRYADGSGKCCVLGHIHRVKKGEFVYEVSDKNPNYTTEFFRAKTREFIIKVHGFKYSEMDISYVNNYTDVNGYTEPTIKARVMHCLEDMIAAGY